jgi:hypothetical protein
MNGFAITSVALYQPDDVLQIRVRTSEALSSYIRQLAAVCARCFADRIVPEPLDIVVLLLPRHRSRIWLVPSHEKWPPTLRQELEEVTPPTVHAGPVALAIIGAIAGADRSDSDRTPFEPPIPQEWRQVIATAHRELVIPDDIVPMVWPDAAEP